jgi:hypothetical protein
MVYPDFIQDSVLLGFGETWVNGGESVWWDVALWIFKSIQIFGFFGSSRFLDLWFIQILFKILCFWALVRRG